MPARPTVGRIGLILRRVDACLQRGAVLGTGQAGQTLPLLLLAAAGAALAPLPAGLGARWQTGGGAHRLAADRAALGRRRRVPVAGLGTGQHVGWVWR